MFHNFVVVVVEFKVTTIDSMHVDMYIEAHFQINYISCAE